MPRNIWELLTNNQEQKHIFFLESEQSSDLYHISIGQNALTYFLVDEKQPSVFDYKEESVSAIEREVNNELKIASSFSALSVSTSRDEMQKVASTLQEICRTGNKSAIEVLLKSGKSAVKPLIQLLGKDIPYTARQIYLPAGPANTIENEVVYGPENSDEVIMIFLSSLTSEDFGFVYNGASASKLKNARIAWRSYQFYLQNSHP